MEESNYFFNQPSWALIDMPDPRDADPVRYAILASLLEILADAFNWKISLGLRRGVKSASLTKAQRTLYRTNPNKPFEQMPEWVKGVPRVDGRVMIMPVKAYETRNRSSIFFEKRGIQGDAEQVYNL